MRTLLAVVFLALATVPRPVGAQEGTAEEQAQAHDERASQLFDEGDYGRALIAFGIAQDLSPSPARILEMARCQEARGNTEAALHLYRAVADHAEVLPYLREFAQQRAEALHTTREAEPAAPPREEEPVVSPPEPAPPGRAPSGIAPTAFYAMLGVTAASGVALTVLGVLVAEDHAAFVDTTCDDPHDVVLEAQRQGRAMVLAADVLLGVTAAAAVTTVVLAIFTRWGRPSPTVSLGSSPSGRGLALSWEL